MQGDRTTGEHGSQDEMLAVLQLAGCVLQDEGVAAEEKKVNSAGQMKPSVDTQVVIRKYIIVGFRGWKRRN